MVFTVYAPNSYTYVYFSNPTPENIIRASQIFSQYHSVTTYKRTINVHISYKVIKCIETPEDLKNYFDEFRVYAENFIYDIVTRYNLEIEKFEISNIIITGLILTGGLTCKDYNPDVHMKIATKKVFDLDVIARKLSEEFGDIIYQIKLSRHHGSSFPGLTVNFFKSPEEKQAYLENPRKSRKPGTASMNIFSKGKYTATNLKDFEYIKTFCKIMDFLSNLPEEERLNNNYDPLDAKIFI